MSGAINPILYARVQARHELSMCACGLARHELTVKSSRGAP